LITFLSGRLDSSSADQAVIDVGGVGFAVTIPASTRARLPEPGGPCRLTTRLIWREDGVHLFGFASRAEAEVFDLLLRVSGVGPKIALGALSTATPHAVLEALALHDVEALRRFPGIGRKTAERILLELKDQVTLDGLAAGRAGSPVSLTADPQGGRLAEAMQALLSLGYSRAEAAAALDAVAAGVPATAGAAELIRRTLQYLAAR
jgi:Holliday junction DNA helicase RuvA